MSSQHCAWGECGEEEKLDYIVNRIRVLDLEREATAYHLIDGEVDLTDLDEWWAAREQDARARTWSPDDVEF